LTLIHPVYTSIFARLFAVGLVNTKAARCRGKWTSLILRIDTLQL